MMSQHNAVLTQHRTKLNCRRKEKWVGEKRSCFSLNAIFEKTVGNIGLFIIHYPLLLKRSHGFCKRAFVVFTEQIVFPNARVCGMDKKDIIGILPFSNDADMVNTRAFVRYKKN